MSKNVTPSSRARRMAASDSSSFVRPHPSGVPDASGRTADGPAAEADLADLQSRLAEKPVMHRRAL